MRVFWLTVCVTLTGLACLSYWADPAQRWHRKPGLPEQPLSPGQAWLWPADNVEDRSLKQRFLELQERPTIAVFGSSRAMLFGHDALRTPRPANLGVSGVNVQDFLGLWEFMKLSRKISSTVVIVADPWIFNLSGHDDRWHPLEKMVDLFEKDVSNHATWTSSVPLLTVGISRAVLMKYRLDEILDLISAQTVAAAWTYLRQRRSLAQDAPRPPGRFAVVSLADFPRDAHGSRWDGTHIYPADVLEPPDVETAHRRGAQFMSETPLYHLADYSIEQTSVTRFSAFLSDLTRHGVTTHIILLPYHPDVFAGMNAAPKYQHVFPQFRSAVAQAVRTSGSRADVCDVLDPKSAGCSATEFMDGMHPLQPCVEKVAVKCLRQQGL
jgi:hypothetical protein